MNALLVYPLFPQTFWSFEGALALVGRKALLPPLGLITVAALLPQEWNLRLIDRNVTPLTEREWAWADVVLLSAMIVQKNDFLGIIRAAKRNLKPVAVGGPYVTAIPQEAEAAGADYLILDEGEITIPLFIQHIRAHGVMRRTDNSPAVQFSAGSEKPNLSSTPIPRYDLLDLAAYDGMSVQYSRGCPFLCEFCDIIALYGRRPRIKNPKQLLSELDRLYELGWRRSIFVVDDNFIGNKRSVKKLLAALLIWQQEHGFPFWFDTEASIDLADDPELLEFMVRCHFGAVFIGIETPDVESLALTRKHQNNRNPLMDSIRKITRAGLRVMCGLIIGFDGEAKGAGQRIVSFIESTNIPTALLSMLQVLPNTGLWERLKGEGRLVQSSADLAQTSALNFVPTRPLSEIVTEYIEAFYALYDPRAYLRRTYHHFLEIGIRPSDQVPPGTRQLSVSRPQTVPQYLHEQLVIMRASLILCWRQGLLRETRSVFWTYLISIAFHKPGLLRHYLTVCAHNEHFLVYRERVVAEVKSQTIQLSDTVYIGQSTATLDAVQPFDKIGG
jgi:radical SAM superfamily enzyme YgiQ (UPF0313 family)